jgi:hypothetical protein
MRGIVVLFLARIKKIYLTACGRVRSLDVGGVCLNSQWGPFCVERGAD